MSKPLRIQVPEQDARDLLEKRQEVDHLPVFRSLMQRVERELGRLRSAKKNSLKPRFPRRSSAAHRRTALWGDKELREAVWERAEGRCENCGRRVAWATFDLDHFLGRARAPQSPENTWALCSDRAEISTGCHQAKTQNRPSRLHWLEVFLKHLVAHGFGESATAREVGAELEAEQLIEKARTIRARRLEAARAVEAKAENVCENGDHPAPAGQRFCSPRCQAEDAAGGEHA